MALGDRRRCQRFLRDRRHLTLVCGLLLQTVLLTAWQLARDRQVLIAMLRAWRPSITAGFMGALASQMWFLAFAIATTAHVRTLALVEILFAHARVATAFLAKHLGAECSASRWWWAAPSC